MLWRVVLETAPGAVRSCPRCRSATSHHPSGAFRVNGNGRRLDVWLILLCERCERTWKLPIHERVRPEVLGTDLVRYQDNDADLVLALACDGARFRAAGAVLGEPGFRVEVPPEVFDQAVRVRVEGSWQPRLDRLLQRALSLSRGAVDRAWKRGHLLLDGGGRKALRRPMPAGGTLWIDHPALSGIVTETRDRATSSDRP